MPKLQWDLSELRSLVAEGPNPSAWEVLVIVIAAAVTVGAALRAVLVAVWRQRHSSPPRDEASSNQVPYQWTRPIDVIDRRTSSGAPADTAAFTPRATQWSRPVTTRWPDLIPHRFMIRVLGPVDLVDHCGAPVAVARSKSLELIAWLSLHRPVCSRDAVRAALWVRDVGDASFANVVSGARCAFVHHSGDPDTEWLGRPQAERLNLAPGVVSDVEVFDALLARARYGSAQERLAGFRRAFELVRGPPFEASAYRWADDEARTSSLTLAVVDAAREWAEAALAEGDATAVLEATSAGLRVLPGHEELVALRLRAHHRAGDLAALRAEWVSCQRALTGDPWQSGPAPWLTDLAESLLCGPA